VVQGPGRDPGHHSGRQSGAIFHSPYFGAKGWIGVGRNEAADWIEVEAFVHRSYRLIAPKRLAKLVA
jgi:predicted DNA-binding protein (MmcQ/YjbR family)